MELIKILLIVFGIISALNLVLYGVDKLKAILGAWRIPEAVLLFFSIFGGGIGGALGMLLFRHKTRHWYFALINALGVLMQLGTIGYLFFSYI